MQRISNILLIAGLALLLTAPAMALGQPVDPPELDVPCCPAPEIDGYIDEVWLDCAEDVYMSREGGDEAEAEQALGRRFAAGALVMHDADHLYFLIVEALEWRVPSPSNDGPVSLVRLSFEDDPPAWWWNTRETSGLADEGWLEFLGYLPDANNSQAPWEEWEFYEGWSEWQFVGRIGGQHGGAPDDCTQGPNPAVGVESDFGVYVPALFDGFSTLQDERVPDLMTVHEIALDLTNSPLNLSVGDSYRGAIGSLPISRWYDGIDAGAEQRRGRVFRWPCCFSDSCLPFEDDDCDRCIDSYGDVSVVPCAVEFVPEPASVLLFGSGLMSLAGYATLRLRKR